MPGIKPPIYTARHFPHYSLMRVFITLLCFSLLAACAEPAAVEAQEEIVDQSIPSEIKAVGESTPIPLRVESGDKAAIKYDQTKIRNGKSQTAKIDVSYEIVEILEDGLLIQWTTNSVEVAGVKIIKSSPMSANFLVGIPLVFEADIDGSPMKVHQKDQLLKDLKKTFSLFVDDSDNIGAVDAVIGMFENMDEESIAQVLFKVPSFLALCHNTDVIQGEPLESQQTQASPFGSGQLLVDASFELTKVSRKTNTASFVYSTKYNEDSMKEMALEVFNQIAPDKTPNDEELKKFQIIRNDTASCDVNLDSGTVKKMKYSTYVEAADETGTQMNEDVYDIEVDWK